MSDSIPVDSGEHQNSRENIIASHPIESYGAILIHGVLVGPFCRLYKAIVKPGYELFDHTADIGIRVFASTLTGLIAPATNGLYAVIGELQPTGQPCPTAWDLRGSDEAILLRDYLNELLLLFERELRMVTVPQVREFTDHRLAVAAQSSAIDPDESTFFREVKAITYHELAISPFNGGYEARIIVDI